MNSTHSLTADSRPWWRESMVWLVISGPLSVVFACIVTAVFIIRNPDPPLSTAVTQMHPADDAEAMQRATSPATMPAMIARNHAAQPIMPPRRPNP